MSYRRRSNPSAAEIAKAEGYAILGAIAAVGLNMAAKRLASPTPASGASAAKPAMISQRAAAVGQLVVGAAVAAVAAGRAPALGVAVGAGTMTLGGSDLISQMRAASAQAPVPGPVPAPAPVPVAGATPPAQGLYAGNYNRPGGAIYGAQNARPGSAVYGAQYGR